MFSLANFTEPSTASTTEDNNVGAVVGVTVGVGTLFLTAIVITTGLVCYFYRSKKKIVASTSTLTLVELADENISLNKTESLQSLKKDVAIENSF